MRSAPPKVEVVHRFLGTGISSVKLRADKAENHAVSLFVPPPPGATEERHRVSAEWVRSKSVPAHQRRVVLYLHGGAYCFGSAASHRKLAYDISRRAEAYVLLVNYRLAPKHPFPAGLYDAMAAYAWLLSPASCTLPGGARRPSEVVIAGDSAGGGLSASLLLALREKATLQTLYPTVLGLTPGAKPGVTQLDDEEESQANSLSMPAGAVFLSGWFDLTCSGESWHSRAPADYLPGVSDPLLHDCALMYACGPDSDGSVDLRHNPIVSPVFYGKQRGGYSGLPPCLLQVGEERILSDTRTLHKQLVESGIDATKQEYEGMPHVFQAFSPLLPEADTAILAIAAFIKRVTPGSAKDLPASKL